MSKITRVVLYKHGVGHFERQATVDGDGEVRLAFRTEEMNDVLKSLTVYDNDGGSVSSISYDNKKPIHKLLSDISLDIPSSGGSVELLASVRGAEVSVSIGSRSVTGQILGVDTRRSAVGSQVCERHLLTLFDEKGRLQTFDLEEVTNVAFLDESLAEDMRFLFKTVFSAKKQDAKTLKIFCRGEGERRLDVSYVVECPVWKTSYRVALEEGEKSHVQGWALVDNPQDEDWKNVELSLVSGLPISFRHDLYSPRYLQRREIEVERESSAGPVMSESALFDEPEPLAEAAPMMDFGASEDPFCAVAPAKPVMSKRARPSPLAALGGGGAPKVETVTQKVGQLFEYKIERPVTVLRNQSALVPIVSGEFEGGKKLLYNERERVENPFSIVDFKNTTGLTLEGGPVTIYEGEIYAGEAMLDTIGPDEERMLSYAVALEVEAKVERDTLTRSVQQVVSAGSWRHKRAEYKETKYRFVNRGGEAKKIVVEHPLSKAELVNTPKPVSETRNYWRFEVDVEPKSSQELKITEKTVRHDVVHFSNSTPQHIIMLIEGAGSGEAYESLVKELKQMLEKQQAINSNLNQLQKTLQEKMSGQDRVRENLKSLGNTEEEKRLRSRYVGQFEADETEIEKLKKEVAAQRLELKQAQTAFSKKVNEVTLERVFE